MKKLAAYTSISSLKEYLLISQDKVAVDLYRRIDGNWVLNSYRDRENIILESIKLKLPVNDVYAEVIGHPW